MDFEAYFNQLEREDAEGYSGLVVKALRAVLALHHEGTGVDKGFCMECEDQRIRVPCSTVRAIEKALEG